MTEEEVKPEPTFLDKAREERIAMEKVRDEIKAEVEKLKQLREEDILSGRAVQPKQVKEPEESPTDYLKKVLEGKAGKK